MQAFINSLPQIAVFVFIVLLAITICRKLSQSEFSEIKSFFDGIIAAAIHELTFRGGRAAKCNSILCVCFALVMIFVLAEDTLTKLAKIMAGTPEGSSGTYVLVALLVLFFIASLCFVFAMERYRKFTSGK